jgi:hypothetical protein
MSSVQRQMHEFLEGLLRHKSDMVNIEAARAICDMKNVTASDLVRPVAGKWYSEMSIVGYRSELTHSAPVIPLLAKGCTQVRRCQDTQQARPDPASGCGCLQLGHGELDHRYQQEYRNLCHHHLAQGMPSTLYCGR